MTREEELGIIIDGIENLDNVAMETAQRYCMADTFTHRIIFT